MVSTWDQISLGRQIINKIVSQLLCHRLDTVPDTYNLKEERVFWLMACRGLYGWMSPRQDNIAEVHARGDLLMVWQAGNREQSRQKERSYPLPGHAPSDLLFSTSLDLSNHVEL